MAVSLTLGPFIGGPMVSRLKLNIRQTIGVVLITHSIACFGYLITMLLPCPEAQWAGTVTQDGLAAFYLFTIY